MSPQPGAHREVFRDRSAAPARHQRARRSSKHAAAITAALKSYYALEADRMKRAAARIAVLRRRCSGSGRRAP